MPEKHSQDTRNNVKFLIAQGEFNKNIVQATGVLRSSTVKHMISEMNLDYTRSKSERPCIFK